MTRLLPYVLQAYLDLDVTFSFDEGRHARHYPAAPGAYESPERETWAQHAAQVPDDSGLGRIEVESRGVVHTSFAHKGRKLMLQVGIFHI